MGNNETQIDLRTALKQGLAQLRDARVPSFTLAAELLLLHVLGRDRTWIYAHPEEEVVAQDTTRYFELIGRRAAGVPTQHLTGKQQFWGLEFEVTPDVLIPRPETEHVIEVALDRLAVRELRAGRPQKNDGSGLRIADIGTGSGCIAITLAKELTAATVYATDISKAALDVARRNAGRMGVVDRIQFLESNLLEAFVESQATSHESRLFDLIVCNPPYIGRREADSLPIEVREHEPHAALYGGEEGYELYGALIPQAAQRLKPGGLLILELGYNSLPAVEPLLDRSDWVHVAVTKDLAGIPRVISAERLLAEP